MTGFGEASTQRAGIYFTVELRSLNNRYFKPGIRLPEPLLPVLVLSYQRRRWLEPSSGSRISLDTRIQVDRAHPLLLSAERDVQLDDAILEVKGEHNELPGPLRHLATIGCVRESVSKYGVCFQRISGGIA